MNSIKLITLFLFAGISLILTAVNLFKNKDEKLKGYFRVILILLSVVGIYLGSEVINVIIKLL